MKRGSHYLQIMFYCLMHSSVNAAVLIYAIINNIDGKLLTFPFVTSSLQGPPNYSTYAGLHSNQILTVKVCPSQQSVPQPSQQPPLSVRLLICHYPCG